ncbi:MAG TPA: hypothetical protein VFV73_00600 [Streptosporangiaceae bacterium]|nr:hypothetical protein [Streptosporangiaceae bacterium]
MTDLPAAGDVLGTPAPVLSPDRVTALAEAVWRLPAGAIRPLTSERDVNGWPWQPPVSRITATGPPWSWPTWASPARASSTPPPSSWPAWSTAPAAPA